MLNIMKLELKKCKISGNILGGFIATFVIMAFVILINYDPEEAATFTGYADVLGVIDVFASITFTIFASALLAKFVIDEYKSKTVTVLFMYPLQRKKLLAAKILIVVMFTFVFGIISRILAFSGFYVFNHFAHFIPGEPAASMLMEQGIRAVINSAMVSCISLVPLYFGMRKYSVVTTIVSGIILCAVLNGTSGNNFTLSSIIFIPATVALIGIAVAYLAIRNVDARDVV